MAEVQINPAGRVPVLKHGELTVWESIAIGEYLCELTGKGWPGERGARSHARAVSAEMHAGFSSLRAQWPMNARATGRRTPMTAELRADIERIARFGVDAVLVGSIISAAVDPADAVRKLSGVPRASRAR